MGGRAAIALDRAIQLPDCNGAAVLLAARARARVIARASEADLDRCRSLGAHLTLDYRDPELTRRIRGVGPDGVDMHLDTSGRHDLEAAVGLLARRGRIVGDRRAG